MSHEMVAAALGLMCIPFLYIRLILHLLRAPYLYSVGKGYVPIMMYADYLIIFLDGQANPQLLGKVWKVVSCFGQFSALKVNLNKTAAIVRNCG